MTSTPLTPSDLKILRVLQTDGRIANVDLAERVGLSPSPCLRRTKQLEANGAIRGYVALLDRKKLGFGVEAFVQVSLERHQDRYDRAFREAVLGHSEIIGCYVMTGEMDYLLHILAKDLEAYGRFTLDVLLKMPGVKDVKSSLALEVVKDSTALPLGQVEAISHPRTAKA
ncbi:MAG: Lrp/AsnC family transcriptional regulator, leucine-responsive regulatory protein [Rhodospirillaceae bacterium]|jgi:Lrp/AsnC family leucine-responsive transcriptional regulator|nr:Lrp/AsnC family transcriptional regulator, leucine-responsive regulatory protein [Rhodospirillaceae bacterium]